METQTEEKDMAGNSATTSIDQEAGGEVPREHKIPRLLSKGYFMAEVTPAHADILLLACCLISGFLDSVVYGAWGTFVSMQTGNTIFIGLGASGQNSGKPFRWAKSLTSIVCFSLGSLFFSRFARLLTPLRRRTLVLSFLIQALIVWITAIIVQTGILNGEVGLLLTTIDWKQEIPIAMLSFQAAGQIVTSRNLGYSEIPSVVLTSVLCDLMSDPKLTSPLTTNAKRNRRFLAFALILIGAISGGWIAKAAGGMQPVLWLAGGIKIIIVCSWTLWPEKN